MAGRTKNNLTQIKKDSAEGRKKLRAMVDSYCAEPTERKASAIIAQLQNVEVSEDALREAIQTHEASLFGGDTQPSPIDTPPVEESDDTKEEDAEEDAEDETPKPVANKKK